MLRFEMHDSINAFIVRLEGRFTSDEADQVRMLVMRCRVEMRLVVDLTEITSTDAVGEEVLWFLNSLGAKFVARTSCSLDVCERLHLSRLSSVSHIRTCRVLVPGSRLITEVASSVEQGYCGSGDTQMSQLGHFGVNQLLSP